MRRGVLLSVLVSAGALSITVAAQRGGPPPDTGPKVVTVEKLNDRLYILKGGGGNTALFITANGVVVVDTKLSGWGPPLIDAIKTITPKPVTMIINTHAHGDHVGGQLGFPGTIDVVAHENTKTNMANLAAGTPAAGGLGDDFKKPENAKWLPKRTFKDKLTLMSGADQIDLYYFGAGHTNGDALVVFPALRTVHVGDLFVGKQVPLVDFGNGGSGKAYPATLAKAAAGLRNVDTVITGHSDMTMTMADLKEYAEFNKDFGAWVQDEMKAGKTAEQAAGEYKVPEKYKGYTANLPPFVGGLKGYIQGIYDELKK